MRIILFILILFSYGCSKKSENPNIIYILADDLGYGEVGVYGQKIIETPNIDSLAEKGILFTDHYSGSPVCAPSRSVLSNIGTPPAFHISFATYFPPGFKSAR